MKFFNSREMCETERKSKEMMKYKKKKENEYENNVFISSRFNICFAPPDQSSQHSLTSWKWLWKKNWNESQRPLSTA